MSAPLPSPRDAMTGRPRRRFPKRCHLRRPAEFAKIYARRCVARQKFLTAFAAANDLGYARIGLSVSKRKHGTAVARNRLKRLLREAFRLILAELPAGIDFVIIPESSGEATLADYQDSLRRAADKLARRLAEGVPHDGQASATPASEA